MTPSSILYSNSTDFNPNDAAAKWDSGNLGAYIQDQIKLSDRLTAQFGLRIETYNLGENDITLNPLFQQRYGFDEHRDARRPQHPDAARRPGRGCRRTTSTSTAAPVFTGGGSPTVWVSNAYSNDGIRLAEAFSSNPSVVNGFDGRNIPQGLKNMIVPGNGDVDAVDPNFRLPSLWKVGGGVDYSFQGVTSSFSTTRTARPTRASSSGSTCAATLDSIPVTTPVGETQDRSVALYPTSFDTSRGFDMLLTNTTQGYGHVATAAIEKVWPWGLTFIDNLRVRARPRHDAGQQLAVGVELRQRRGDRPEQLPARAVRL